MLPPQLTLLGLLIYLISIQRLDALSLRLSESVHGPIYSYTSRNNVFKCHSFLIPGQANEIPILKIVVTAVLSRSCDMYGGSPLVLRLVLAVSIIALLALDPISLPSEASQLVKQRLLNFVRSLSTVLAFAYCLSRWASNCGENCVHCSVGCCSFIVHGVAGVFYTEMAYCRSAMIHATRPFIVNEWIQTKIEGYDVSGTVESIVADMRKVLAKNPQVEQQRLHRRVFLENINPENQALLVSLLCFLSQLI
ncbi:hypothetical protein IFM89_036691 [Coptis chinensis]|uniref:Uncharacterized protein n=1 Tax=Coptis chinensis TaxID=261450 RepID=A0A835I9R2_9MAGN|nr:hypothetical protein IFM89_036691 [Coptis chinensis]